MILTHKTWQGLGEHVARNDVIVFVYGQPADSLWFKTEIQQIPPPSVLSNVLRFPRQGELSSERQMEAKAGKEGVSSPMLVLDNS